MGKCSGLKGGGHHRKAVDLAEKKKNEKLNRKKEQAAAGKRAVILRDVLCKIDPHCDLYLDAVLCDGNKHGFHDKSNCHSNNNDNSNNNNNDNDNKLPDLCRAHFRHEGCTNKRCKFSHDYSISEALANVVSGTNTNTNTNTSSTDTDHDHDESAPTLPALRHLPGIHGDLGKKKKKKRRLFLVPDDSHSQSTTQSTSTQSPFGNALSVLEGSSAIDTIVSCLESNQDVVSFGLVCKRLCMLVLEGTTGNDNGNGNGVGCRDVQWRKHRCKERTLERRNNMLLSTKALSGSLRYAVVYFENNRSSTSSKAARSGKGGKKNHTNKSNKSKSNKPPSLRPVLVFDYENPHVYKAFQESGQVVNSKEHCLSSALAKDCTIHKTGE